MDRFPKSDLRAERLRGLEKKGFLPARGVSGARLPQDPRNPVPEDGEALVHAAFFERGLGLPLHPFVRGLLFHYGLQLHHLNPNGVLHLAFFITLCEAFLGIAPHWTLWRHLFRVAPQKNKTTGEVEVVGGAMFQLKSSRSKVYFRLPLPSSNRGWHGGWFFVKNNEGSVPAFTGEPAAPLECWQWGADEREKKKLEPYLEAIGRLKQDGLRATHVIAEFMRRRVQPLKARGNLMWNYTGMSDPSRESEVELSGSEVEARVRTTLSLPDDGTEVELSGPVMGLALGVTRDLVSFRASPQVGDA
jgi:Putative gypsy type transposon